MSKITIELNPQQITQAVEELPDREKLKIAELLEKETISLRWKHILKDIDCRLKRFPVSKTDVLEEIRACRKAKHAKSRN